MAQEIRRFTWCDLCAAEDDNMAEPGESFAVTVNGFARVIDLCERHRKTLVDPLREVVAEHGYKEGDVTAQTTRAVPANRTGRKAASLDHPCLWCPQKFGGPGSLALHMHRDHGFPKAQGHGADINGIFGKACPYCGDKMGSPARFGMHIYRRHEGNARKMSAAYQEALAMGDPAGVVAPVLALAPEGQYAGPRRRARTSKR